MNKKYNIQNNKKYPTLVFNFKSDGIGILSATPTPEVHVCGKAFARTNTPDCRLASQAIINGQDANPKAWPWQLHITTNNTDTCGGILIHPKYAITAAHCIEEGTVQHHVYGGLLALSERHNTTNKGKTWWESPVKRITNHPNYIRGKCAHDISLMELETRLPLNERLNLVCLPENGDTLRVEDSCYVTGWGDTENGAKNAAQILQEICLPYLQQLDCINKNRILGDDFFNNGLICADTTNGRYRVGKGDSGGPYVCRKNGVWKLFGVLCANSLSRGQIFLSSIVEHHDWIQRNII
ncbi:unnamed protein product [Gordionus sp. m RMFG-2023]